MIADYQTLYNEHRPHSALHYPYPRDYCRGDPVNLLAEREAQLRAAAEQRRHYWEEHGY